MPDTEDPFSDEIDKEKLAEVALAILSFSAHEEEFGVLRAWKGMSWDLTDLLFEKGWIQDPKSKAKSVCFTREGQALVDTFVHKHFAKNE